MGFFSFLEKNTTQKPMPERPPMAGECLDDFPTNVKMAEATRYFEMFQESVDIISKTVYCRTFFYRYGFAVENASRQYSYDKLKAMI